VYGVVYKVENKVNGKCYIGQTTKPLEERKCKHYSEYSGCFKLKAALQKYNKNNFLWDILYVANSRSDLDRKEIFYIGYFDSINYGYNIKKGGSYGKHNQVTKEKIGKANAGKKRTKEAKKKISEALKGKNVGQNNSFYGKNHTTEVKKIISQANSKQYIFVDPSGEEYFVSNGFIKFCKDNNISPRTMGRRLKDQKKSKNGWAVRYCRSRHKIENT